MRAEPSSLVSALAQLVTRRGSEGCALQISVPLISLSHRKDSSSQSAIPARKFFFLNYISSNTQTLGSSHFMVLRGAL